MKKLKYLTVINQREDLPIQRATKLKLVVHPLHDSTSDEAFRFEDGLSLTMYGGLAPDEYRVGKEILLTLEDGVPMVRERMGRK